MLTCTSLYNRLCCYSFLYRTSLVMENKCWSISVDDNESCAQIYSKFFWLYVTRNCLLLWQIIFSIEVIFIFSVRKGWKWYKFDWSYKSSHRRCSLKNMFLKISQNSQKQLCQNLIFKKIEGWDLKFIEKETLAEVFSCKMF